MKMSGLAAMAAACAMGSVALGQNVVPVGELSTCQTGVAGTLTNTGTGFDGTCGEAFVAASWSFYTFYGVAGQVIDIEGDRAVGELDLAFALWRGDATGIPLADFADPITSTNPSVTLLSFNDDEDPAAVPGPFGDPLLTGFVLPATDVYTLIVFSNCSNAGAVSYDYVINMSALGATIDNITQATNHPTLQDAVNSANAGDTIEIGAGTLCENVNIDKALTIRGAGKDATVIDGAFLDRCVFVDVPGGSGGLFRLEGVTLVNGSFAGFGGGLLVDADILTTEIVDVCFLNNSGTNYGGFFKNGGADTASSTLIDGCAFIENSQTAAGGANSAGGMGISFQSSNAIIRNCLFKNNYAENRASALYMQSQFDYVVDIVNCTFVEHDASPSGDNNVILAINNGTFDIEVVNCVFNNGTGDRILIGANSEIRNSVLGDGAFLSGGIVDAGGNVTTSPTFEDAANGDYRLAAGSSGIDMGDLGAYFGAGGGIEDLNGDVRISDDPTTTNTGSLGSALDAGAYEFQATVADTAPCEGDANGDGAVDVNDISYVLFRLGNPCP